MKEDHKNDEPRRSVLAEENFRLEKRIRELEVEKEQMRCTI